MVPKIYTEPTVTLIAQQRFKYPAHINWRSDVGDTNSSDEVDDRAGEVLAEFSGRLCYLSFGEDAGIEGHKTVQGRAENRLYLENILKVKHGSVLEHAVYTFLFEGISRSLTHELVRHRAGMAYSQLSQRYVDESNVAFVLPPELTDPDMHFERDVFEASARYDLRQYEQILSSLEERLEQVEGISVTDRKKRARQTARSVLPNCTETKIVVTGNARAWRHFIEMRGAPGADREIRRVAVSVVNTLQAEAPHIFGDYTVEQHPEHGAVVTTLHTKV
jgi:thymidylate synthase (FAD)